MIHGNLKVEKAIILREINLLLLPSCLVTNATRVLQFTKLSDATQILLASSLPHQIRLTINSVPNRWPFSAMVVDFGERGSIEISDLLARLSFRTKIPRRWAQFYGTRSRLSATFRHFAFIWIPTEPLSHQTKRLTSSQSWPPPSLTS